MSHVTASDPRIPVNSSEYARSVLDCINRLMRASPIVIIRVLPKTGHEKPQLAIRSQAVLHIHPAAD